MDSKNKTIILVVLFIIIILLAIVIFRNNDNNKETVKNDNTVVYNEADGTYTVYDENQEVKTVVNSQAEAQKYIDNPDYDPGIPEVPSIVGETQSTDIVDSINQLAEPEALP